MDTFFNKVRFLKPGCDWQITFENPRLEGDELIADNFTLAKAAGTHFHMTLCEGQALGKDLLPFKFWAPIIFEHGDGHKIGDVVLIFRKNPNGRWMVQIEHEDIYENENTIIKVIRSARSSLDNVLQAVKKLVSLVGYGYSNGRRIGGKPFAQHYVQSNWAPNIADKMMDVFEYVQCPDSIGQAVFLKALQHMSDKMAREIFNQIRKPATTVD